MIENAQAAENRNYLAARMTEEVKRILLFLIIIISLITIVITSANLRVFTIPLIIISSLSSSTAL